MKDIFTAKILLFGEYTIITSSQALVTPLRHYTGSLELPARPEAMDQEQSGSNLVLNDFQDYLQKTETDGRLKIRLKLEAFRKDLQKGLWFRSDIPREYGAGSSAALVAAIASRYGSRSDQDAGPENLSLFRMQLAQMESFFHGQSSGIDPLCAALGRSILLDGEHIRPVDLPALPSPHQAFLIDTGSSGSTGPLVRQFKTRLQDPTFSHMVERVMAPLVGRCIRCFIEGDQSELASFMHALSVLQYEHFRAMIPAAYHPFWEQSLQEEAWQLKLCGSGGGGFLMGYTSQWTAVKNRLIAQGIEPLPVELS